MGKESTENWHAHYDKTHLALDDYVGNEVCCAISLISMGQYKPRDARKDKTHFIEGLEFARQEAEETRGVTKGDLARIIELAKCDWMNPEALKVIKDFYREIQTRTKL